MKILKKVLIGLGVVVALFVITSLFIPSKVHVERSAVIKASPDTLFALVNELKNWNKWSAWAQIDPDHTKWIYSQPSSGIGAWYTWESENPDVGKGKLTIVKAETNKYIKNTMDFGEMGIATSEFVLEEVPQGTKITFTMDTDMGMNPVGKYMGLMMDKWVGNDYEKCLKNMAKISKNE